MAHRTEGILVETMSLGHRYHSKAGSLLDRHCRSPRRLLLPPGPVLEVESPWIDPKLSFLQDQDQVGERSTSSSTEDKARRDVMKKSP